MCAGHWRCHSQNPRGVMATTGRDLQLPLPTWIALGCNPLPDRGFLFLGHEDPMGYFIDGTAATATDIVEGGGTNRHAWGIGTLRRRL